MRCFYIRSDDDGLTFTKPVEITATFDQFRPEYDWKVLATGPAHGIQLKSGRLLVPVWLSPGTGGHAHRPCVTARSTATTTARPGTAARSPCPTQPSGSFPTRRSLASLPTAA